MISKNKLKFYMCIPVYGTLACLRILQNEQCMHNRITYDELLRATFFPGITMVAVSFIVAVLALYICDWVGIDGSLIAGFSAIIIGGYATNLVFYKYYKRHFAMLNIQDEKLKK